MQSRGKELTEPEIQTLLAGETPTPDEELSELTLMDAYQFSDGRILFLFDGEPPTGTLWPSRDSVPESLNPNPEAEQGHILEGRLLINHEDKSARLARAVPAWARDD